MNIRILKQSELSFDPTLYNTKIENTVKSLLTDLSLYRNPLYTEHGLRSHVYI